MANTDTQARLASGLLNTSQQLGGAIGIAIASTIAASHTKALLHGGHAARGGSEGELPVRNRPEAVSTPASRVQSPDAGHRAPFKHRDVGAALGGGSAPRTYAFATTSPTSTLSKVMKSPGS